MKLQVTPAEVQAKANLAPGEVDLTLPAPPETTIDYVAADMTSDGNIVVGFRDVPAACAPNQCASGCTQVKPRVAMYTILYAGEQAFRPPQPFRTPTGHTCGASQAKKRIDYVSVQADPPNGALGGRGAWLTLGDEDGRIVGLVTP